MDKRKCLGALMISEQKQLESRAVENSLVGECCFFNIECELLFKTFVNIGDLQLQNTFCQQTESEMGKVHFGTCKAMEETISKSCLEEL
jgi:hypothetical protein